MPSQSLQHREWSAWLQLVTTFTLLPAALETQLQRDAGRSHVEFEVMVALSRQPDRRLELKDLAVLANGSMSRLSHVVSRLEARAWVRRTSGTRGRATYAELTDKGYRKLMEAGPIHLTEVRRLVFDVLTPDEVKALRQVTSRINSWLLGADGRFRALARGTPERSAPPSSLAPPH